MKNRDEIDDDIDNEKKRSRMSSAASPDTKRSKITEDKPPTLKVIPPKPKDSSQQKRITVTLTKPKKDYKENTAASEIKVDEKVEELGEKSHDKIADHSKKMLATLEILDKMKFAPGQREEIIRKINDSQKDGVVKKSPIVINDDRLISIPKEISEPAFLGMPYYIDARTRGLYRS